MTDCRIKVWQIRTGKSGASSIKLCTLPPTQESFMENVRRAHFQVAIWKAALLESPLNMNPTIYGWEMDHEQILKS